VQRPEHRSQEALAVVAHPDDESFGLGAVLSALGTGGVTVRVLCLTHGEASTLGEDVDLAAVRAAELRRAAAVLGIGGVALLGYPDGGLSAVAPGELDAVIESHLGGADLLVVFEPGGVTGHPDHRAATAAAARVAARRGLPVIEWGVPPDVAVALNNELATSFVLAEGSDHEVDRSAQMRAIRCHESQARDNPVLHRRLELQGARERLRLVEPRRPTEATSAAANRTFASTAGTVTRLEL
jgi:LmbE family N-acetylglucosaminyl deacetylase